VRRIPPSRRSSPNASGEPGRIEKRFDVPKEAKSERAIEIPEISAAKPPPSEAELETKPLTRSVASEGDKAPRFFFKTAVAY
jgi:hypothetical protein